MMSTVISPKVSHARRSTSKTLTVLAPWPISLANSGMYCEMGSSRRALMANMPTTVTARPTPTASHARRRPDLGSCFHSVFAGMRRSTSMKSTIMMVSTRSCVSAKSGAP